MKDQAHLKLYYFDIKGYGEPIRLFCAYAGLELEDYRFPSYADFLEMKKTGKFVFGQVPMLEIDGKTQLFQTRAILRYLSKITGRYPEDPIVAARIDAALDCENDAFCSTTVLTYQTRYGIELDEAATKKSFGLVSDEVMPRHLSNLEKVLKGSETGFIAGTTEPTVADFLWFSRLFHAIPEISQLPEKVKTLEDFPILRAFMEKMLTLEAVKTFYKEN